MDKIKTLIVGGGNVALEKLTAILKNEPNAIIKIVASEISPEIEQTSINYPSVSFIQKDYHIDDIEGINLVIAATNSYQLNGIIHMQAKEKGILSNVADTPEFCDFYLGSTVKKGHLKIGISTNGKSPTFAKRLREYLEKSLPDNTDETLDNLNQIRNRLNGNLREKIDYLNQVTASLLREN